MAPKKFLRSAKPGSVMALMLFAVVLLLLSGVGVLTIGQTTRIFSIRTAADVAARSAADAGITKAVWAMNRRLKAETWSGLVWQSPKELPNSDATYSFIVVKAMKLYGDILPSGNEDLIEFIRTASWKEGDYVTKSVGRYAGAEKVIYAIVGLKGVGDAGVLVRDSITLKSGTTVAARDSSDPTNLDPDVFLEIGTISTDTDKVTLNSGVIVEGNVLVGVSGIVNDVIKDLGASTGFKYPFPEEPYFPFIYPPAGLTDWGRRLDNIKGETVTLGPGDSGQYDLIRLKNAKKDTILEIAGGDVVMYVTGDIDMGNGCEIIIREGATLNLYVDGDITAGNSNGFNNQGTPPDLKLWGNWRGPDIRQDWELKAKTEYFGQVYAPNADLIVKAKADMYGAFTANSFEMKSGGNLYYDGALRDVDRDDEGISFVLKRWYE